jgi:WD40 repeat protein
MSSFAQLDTYRTTGDTQGGEPLPQAKKAKKSNAAPIPSSMMVNFLNQEGEQAGSQVDIPVATNVKQMEALVNSLQENKDPTPYAFYVNDVEVTSSIIETLQQLQQEYEDEGKDPLSLEDTLNISFRPLSVFRVRPVTRCIETLPGHTDAVLHVSFSPDGKKLASGGGDMAVRFWNPITNMPSHVCTGHKHHVLCTAWSPCGTIFASADRSGEIRLWDPATGSQRGSAMKGHTKWITSLAFEPIHVRIMCGSIVLSRSIPAYLPAFSDTIRHESNHHPLTPSLNQSSIETTYHYYNIGTRLHHAPCEQQQGSHREDLECH